MDGKEIAAIKAKQAAWEGKSAGEFKQERKKEFCTDDGIQVKRIYTPADLESIGFDYLDDVGFSGEYPFTRGIDPTVHRGNIYFIGQYAGSSSVEETNNLYKKLLAKGQEELHVAFDVASITGHNSDDPLVKHDVGKCGLAVDSLQDMEILYDGIDLSKVYCLYVFIPLAIIMLAMHVAVAEKQGVPWDKIQVCPQNDVLKTYAVSDNPVFPPDAGMRLSADVSSYIARNLPHPHSLAFNICIYHLGEAGANRIQQAAYTLAATKAHVRAALKRGVDIDEIGPKIAYLGYTNHREFLLEIAKVRAMRRMYARIMRDEFGAKDPLSQHFWVHNANGGIDMTREPLELNQARSAISTLAMALSGTQSIGGATFDEPLGVPSARASQIAILTRYLVAHECGVMDTVDPLAGSYYMESMTSEIEKRASEEMQKIEDMGGMLEAVKKGYVQTQIAENAFKEQKRIENGDKITIGLNMLTEDEAEESRGYYKPNPRVLASQTAKLQKLKAERDNEKVESTLNKIREFAKKPESDENNLVPHVMDAVKAYATVGEIAGVLREVFGVYRNPVNF